MAELLRGNAVIGQAGGPTAVINQSLVGVIEGLRAGLHAAGHVPRILGMRHGVRGLTTDDLLDLTTIDPPKLERLATTPSAGLGSTRDKPDAASCQRILDACRRHDVRFFFYIGGNDSCDTCRLVSEIAAAAKHDLRCFHVPKTIDNDLVENDHCPGYPSAARYVALAFMADFMDNRSLPGIKINAVMGRNAGFLTAAAALARDPRQASAPIEDLDGPQLIYVPEVAFDIDRFIADVERVHRRTGRCHVAVSEGIRNVAGELIGAALIANAPTDAHGNAQLSGSGALGDMLAELVKKRLTPTGGKPPRVRADTFGYLQRCWPDPSPVDAREARMVGRHAAELAAAGQRGASVTLRRTMSPGMPYQSSCGQVDLAAVAAKTRLMPREFLAAGNNVTAAFLEYARPLVGPLPTFERL
jgi:ATP-dependent phosphofructokinase / diphosphate-dependent phosphofructokinase